MALSKAQQRIAEKNRKYWQDREDEQLRKYMRSETAYDAEIKRIYSDMLDNVQAEINAFYGRYAAKEGISISEAKKRVAKMDIEAYERKARRYVREKNFSAQANEEMRLYNLTMKVNRLEMLKANIGIDLIAGHDELEKFMDEILQGRTMEELERQAGILGKTIQNNAKTAHSIVNASFHNATFSQRIWANMDLLRAEIGKQLQSGLIAGKNPRVLAKEIKKRFETSTFNAERLMRTELARVQTDAQQKSFEKNGFEQYQFIVNSGCCPICEEIARKNGGIYNLKDMQPGFNAPPVHPHCRCSTAAYESDADYEAWLDYLAAGGTTEEYNNSKKERLSAKTAKNIYGKEIEFDFKGNEEKHLKQKNIIQKLASEYKTRLHKVTVGAKKAAGTVDMSGATMRLNAIHEDVALHEFAHTLANSDADKYGLTSDKEFWKEIRKVKRAYHKDVDKSSDTSRWISFYEHSNKSIDEFFAEAFAHAKMREMGIEIPDKYGSDFTYSEKVLKIVDKYFKKVKNGGE